MQVISTGLLTILLLSICLLDIHKAFAQTDQTNSKLPTANDAANQAFNAVLDAEKSDVIVIDLLPRLINATRILAQAENSFLTGDFNTVAAKANSVILLVQQVSTAT